MHLTWLDNNSWLIELAEQRILLDPWLVGPLVFGNAPWLIKGQHTEPRSIPNYDLLLLSQGLEDHAHPETLQRLDRNLPVVASPNAAKVVQQMGFTQVTVLAHGETFQAGKLTIQAVPGSPIGPFLVENGYLISGSGIKLYYEPHGNHSSSLQQVGSVDVVITPVVNLEIPLLGPIIKGRESVMELLQWLQPKVLLPTAAGGDVEFGGILAALLRGKGSPEELRQELWQSQIPTRLVTPKPGERLDLLDLQLAST